MIKTIYLPRDRELLTLIFSGIAVLHGLLWMFFGQQFIESVTAPYNQAVIYNFLSGIIFSFLLLGIYGFIRTILSFTEFRIEPENLTSLFYDNILQDDNDGVFFKNKKGTYKIISPIAKTILGLEDKRVIGFNDMQLHKPTTANRIQHEDMRIIDLGETIQWESTIKTDLGNDTYLCKKFPCRDYRGNIVGIAGTCKNITALKAFQDLNQQLDGRYQNLFNTLPYPALVVNPSNMQVYTSNDAMSKLLGYTSEEFSRMRISLHIPPDDLKQFSETILALRESGGGEFEARLINKQRDIVFITGHAQTVKIDDICYLHILLYDNTEARKSTESLISSELKYRSLFEHANDAIIIVSPHSQNIIDANEIAIQTLGYSRDQLLLLSIQDLDASPDHLTTQSKIADLEIYNHTIYEHDIFNRQGQLIPVEINAHKLNYGNQEVYQFVIRNISIRKETEKALIASEKRYRQMFKSNRAIKLVIDPDNFTIEDANIAAAEFYGYKIEQLKGMSLSEINILSRDKLNILIQQTREQNLGFYSCPHKLANGEIRFVEVRDGPVEIDGRHLFYSIIYDVTANKQAQDQAMVASKMFDYSTDAVMLINDNNQIVSVNYAFTKITGYQQSEILHSEPEIILANSNKNLISDDVAIEIEKTGQWKGEVWHRLKNGQSRPLNATINIIISENSKSSYVVMLSLKHVEIFSLENRAHFVELTQLPNKSLFLDRLQISIERAKRNKKRLALVFIDFRNFSSVNKQYSYDLGDKILAAISKRLKYNTRSTDTIGHLSSDDFAILFEDLTDIQQMGIVLQKLISTLSEDYQTSSETISLDVSMGVSIFPEDGTTEKELYTQAKNALAKAEQLQGNHFQFTNTNMNQLANLWLDTESNLHSALRHHEFTMKYLPVINSKNNSLFQLEALIRWDHPEFGCLLPQQFIPAAEQSGFIGAIGTYIIDHTLSQLRIWLDHNLPIQRLSINISASQLDSDFPEILIDKCATNNLNHELIALEFSEQKFLHCTDIQRKLIARLKESGFYIILDDFGLSNRSLGCLLQSDINALKIHQNLMIDAQRDRKSKKLLTGITALCHSMGIDIIAEGVESQPECAYLQSMNIYLMQGHHFFQPLLIDEVPGILEHYTH